MVPRLDNARARQSCRNQKQADPRLGLVGLRPHRIPFQDRRAGRVNLAAAQPPAGFGLPRNRRRQSATLGGARALNRDDVGRLTPGSRADAVLLDAPSYMDLVYRPGVPLVAASFVGGRQPAKD